MKRTLFSALLACFVATTPPVLAGKTDCSKVGTTVKKLVTAKPHNLLAIVEDQVAANPSCACEVVKASIVATEAYPDLVGQIVATAVAAAPDKMRVITTCAIAVAPDALPQIKAVLAKLDPKQNTSWKLGIGAKSGLETKAPAEDPGPAPGAKDALGAKDAKGGMAPTAAAPEKKSPLDGPYFVVGLPHIHPPMLQSTCTPDQFPNIKVINP